MELSLEAYRNIVNYVGNRTDIATLCRVSKSFRHVAERALYNTLYMRQEPKTIQLCNTLSIEPRLSFLVDALTINFSEESGGRSESEKSEGEDEDEDEDEHEEEEEVEKERDPGTPADFWSPIAGALQKLANLRHLNLHISSGPNTSNTWILNDTTFRLRSFHCDLNWDTKLVAFFNRQTVLDDLYIIDFNTTETTLNTDSLLKLSILECTFTEAALEIVPGRPITHLKTCFSRSEIGEKRQEMTTLLSSIKLSTSPILSLDIADSLYSEQFSMELLASLINIDATSKELRYLGTLVLPISGRERLEFYGLLMRLPRIQCVEVEVSEWDPQPATAPAFRALASELRLYTPSVTRIVFVHNYDRTVVTVVNGVCRVDYEVNTDIVWREI